MYCYMCKRSVEEYGGTQLTGCKHFLCLKCIRKRVRRSDEERVLCSNTQGVYKCNGYISLKVLEHLVPEEDFAAFVERIAFKNNEYDVGDSVIGAVGTNKTHLEDLNISEDERKCGWAHKASLIDELVRYDGFSKDEAIEFLDNIPLVETRGVTSCPLCLDDEIPTGEGVVLKDCLHMFCKNCLRAYIEASEDAEVICPFRKDEFACSEPLKTSEIRGLVSEAEFQRHFEELSLREAESNMRGTFHCLTANCKGFCIVDEGNQENRIFVCPICQARNCPHCKVIHDGTCAEYRQILEDAQNRNVQMQNERISENQINQNVSNRQWMRCPRCNVVIEKNQGCAHMTCRCGHQFNWTGVPS